MRLKDADTIIYLDYDFKVYKQGIIERTKKCNGKPRPDIPNCIDRLDESFNKFVDEYEETRGKAWKEKLKQLKTEINIFIFSSREETEEFFERYYKQ